jgi:hypothetical protein
MSLEIKKISTETIQEERDRIVPLFHIYCTSEYGDEAWTTFMADPVFHKLMTVYHEKYGDSIFKDLADIVASAMNIPIKDLLADFGNFVNTYY